MAVLDLSGVMFSPADQIHSRAMTRYYLSLTAAISCAICLHLLGGQIQEEAARAPLLIAAQTNAEVAAPVEEPAEDQAASEPELAEPEPSDEPEEVAFAAPFPDRVDMFQAPKRSGRGGVKSKGQGETAVELLGFVDVNGPRVALAIGGTVTTLAEGGEEYGIEVISIQPPAVVLQRGRQRWQASFEN